MRDSPARIMIADEQPADAAAVVQALEDDGYAFLFAHDGEEALRLALGERPDLIILDAEVPKRDAFAVTRALRDNPDTKNTAIIIVGEVRSAEVAAQSFESGADDFVAKPIVPAHLRARVQTWLLRSKSRG